MKKLLSLTLSLLMIFVVIPMTMTTAIADNYTYMLFDADTFTGTIKENAVGVNGDIDIYTMSPSYNNKLSLVDSTLSGGSKVLQVTREVMHDAQGVMYADKNLGSLAATSSGISFLAAADTDTSAKLSNCINIVFKVTYDGVTTYYSADGSWGSNLLGDLTAEGRTYEIKWADMKLNASASFKKIQNRCSPASGQTGAEVNLTSKMLAGLEAVNIVFEDAYCDGSVYYIDDIQLTYENEAPTTVAETTETTTIATTTTTATTLSATETPSATTSYGIIFDADTFTGTIKENTVGANGDIDVYNISPSYNNNISIINSTLSGGTKVLKVLRTSMLDVQGFNYASSDLGALAKESEGIKFWAAADISTSAELSDCINVGFKITVDGTTSYYSADGSWGSNILGDLTAEGRTYEIKWSDMKLNASASFKDGQNRLSPASGQTGAEVNLTDEMLAGLEAVCIVFEDAYCNGSAYYFDDLQFILPETDEELSASAEVVATTDVVVTQSSASIRLNSVNGMRFYTTVDDEALMALTGENEYRFGTLIAPTDLAGDELTVEDAESRNALNVVYGSTTTFWSGNKFAGSIVNIKNINYNREFVARGYVKVGENYYYSKTTCTHTIAAIADAYIADVNGGYGLLDSDIKSLVDTWAKAND